MKSHMVIIRSDLIFYEVEPDLNQVGSDLNQVDLNPIEPDFHEVGTALNEIGSDFYEV